MKLCTVMARCAVAAMLLPILLPVCAMAAQSLAVPMHDGQRQAILVDGGGSGPRPLVLVLHGHIGTAANALGGGKGPPSPLSAWAEIAQREHLLVAALQGNIGSDRYTGWNDCRSDAVEDPRTDDVGFAERVVSDLIKQGRADPHRIYVMGMSNGGMMAFRLALQMQPAPAAIAAVSAGMAAQSACGESTRRVSVLMINGTDDPIVPFPGGKVGARGHKTGTVVSAAAARDFWLRADGLSQTVGIAYSFPHLSAGDPTQATRVTYGPAGGPQVEVITVRGGGHVEPSRRYHYGWLYRQIVGTQNQDFESAEEAWAFFKDKTSP